MAEDERFQPTPRQQGWLDSLSPEARHAASDALHGRWFRGMDAAQSVDEIVDLLLPSQKDESSAGLLTYMALFAEALRAYARGDQDAANQFSEAALRHWTGGPIRIEIDENTER